MVLLYQRQFTEHDEKINYAKNHYFDQTISLRPFIFLFERKNMKKIFITFANIRQFTTQLDYGDFL